jgi:hypothetical protein
MFTLKFTPRVAAAVVVSLLAVTTSQMSWAVGTDAGTTVTNTATVNFTLSGVPQALNSNALTFEVDRQIDLTVTWQDANNVGVIPGTTAGAPAPFAVLRFTVQNTGNDTLDFALAATNNVNGTPSPDVGLDGFDAGPTLLVFAEDGTTPGYQVAEDTAIFIDDLLENASQDAYIVSDIPGGTAAALIAVMTLTATATDNAGVPLVADGDGDDPNLVENVFADAGRNGFEAADGAYVVQASDIAISKNTTVLDDQIAPLGANEYAVPGALVQYEIQITNNHPTDTATGVSITDDISGEIGQIAFAPNGYAAGSGIQLQINAGAPTNLTNLSDSPVDEGEFNGGTNTVTVGGITLTPGDTAFVRFTVTIQ